MLLCGFLASGSNIRGSVDRFKLLDVKLQYTIRYQVKHLRYRSHLSAFEECWFEGSTVQVGLYHGMTVRRKLINLIIPLHPRNRQT